MMTDTAHERLIVALEKFGSKVVANGAQTMAQCPHHDDGRPSLAIKRTTGSVLLYCHAGCDTDDVLADLALTKADLFDNRRDVTYPYPDGRRVKRTPDKRFRQEGVTKSPAGKAALYRGEEAGVAAMFDNTVYVVEGEKDADMMWQHDLPAVSSPGGAGKWHLVDPFPLLGAAEVVIVADRDAAGHKHAADVLADLTGKVRKLRVVMSARDDLKDATDHLIAGYGPADFVPVSIPAGGTDGGSPAEPDGETAKEMKVRNVSGMAEPDPPLWVAVGYLPQAIAVLTGDEGIGKSLWWVRVAAHITTGQADPTIGLPGGNPRDVIIVVTEDAWGEVHARLTLAEADLNHVHLVCEADDGSGVPEFPPDIGLLDEAAEKLDLALVVVDAWIDTAPSKVNTKDAKQARNLLAPWREFTARRRCGVLLLVNTNRLAGVSLRERVGITAELRKKARLMLHGEAPPDEPDVLLVGPDKVNGVVKADAVRYRIERVQVRPRTDHDPGTVARLISAESTGRFISQHIQEWEQAKKTADRPPSADERVDRWLRQFMESHSGKVLASSGIAAAKLATLSETRVTARLKALGGQSRPETRGGPFWWVLATARQDSEGGVHMSGVSESSETSGSQAGLWT